MNISACESYKNCCYIFCYSRYNLPKKSNFFYLDKGMDGDDDIPAEHQTDEVKNILNQLGELKREKESLAERIQQIDVQVNELQKQLMSEKKRTSSVSDNIKVLSPEQKFGKKLSFFLDF